jgi:hypothetical protein
MVSTQVRLRSQSIIFGISEAGKSGNINANADNSTSKGIDFEGEDYDRVIDEVLGVMPLKGGGLIDW